MRPSQHTHTPTADAGTITHIHTHIHISPLQVPGSSRSRECWKSDIIQRNMVSSPRQWTYRRTLIMYERQTDTCLKTLPLCWSHPWVHHYKCLLLFPNEQTLFYEILLEISSFPKGIKHILSNYMKMSIKQCTIHLHTASLMQCCNHKTMASWVCIFNSM